MHRLVETITAIQGEVVDSTAGHTKLETTFECKVFHRFHAEKVYRHHINKQVGFRPDCVTLNTYGYHT